MTNYSRLLRTWKRLRTFQYRDLEHIKAFQLTRFKKLLRHAYDKIPMYREFYDSHGITPSQVRYFADIEEVPVITKDIIRSFPIKKRVDPNISEKLVHKVRTSGSTGEPLEIWNNRTESLIQTLKGIRFLREWGYSPLDNTIRLWGEDSSETKKSVVQKYGLFKRKDLAILDQPDIAINEILKSGCDVLIGVRSSLEALADALEKSNAEIKPHICVSMGEMIMEEHRKRFEKQFGCKTLSIYGCEEIGNIAWECPKFEGNLHVDMETVILNLKENNFSNEEQFGSVITTNLESYTMPFIRYKLGDYVNLPENKACKCGRTLPLLGEIRGRHDDVLEYNGRKYYWNFFYNHLVNMQYIKKYKIIQTIQGSIEFRILLSHNNEDTRRKCIADLNAAFKDHFSPLNIRFVYEFQLPHNRKFKVLEKEK
jgi:phenylacetate-CoA ligase